MDCINHFHDNLVCCFILLKNLFLYLLGNVNKIGYLIVSTFFGLLLIFISNVLLI